MHTLESLLVLQTPPHQHCVPSVENRTPLQNSLHELWALLNFLVPDVFASAEQFDEWFNLDIEDNDEKNKLISQLHKILRPFMLRRLKKEVEKNLPPKHETILYTGMSAMQKKLYRDILIRDIDAIQGNSGSRTAILNIVMQLRKCAGHPYLFPGVEDRTLPPLGEHLVENCGKMVLLDKLLKRLKERGDRVLLFTQMTRILDIMEDYLVMRRYNYCRIDGNTTYEVREDYIDSFNKPDSEKFIFLLSTRAGGLGINLQTANVVILYDSDWNPQADLQAQDRAHRIGQKKEVQVFRFVTEHTVEEKIVERAQQKLKLDAMVVQQGRLKEKDKQLSRDDLLEAVRFGADKIFKSKDSSITDDDIDLILDAGKRKTQELNEKLQAADKGDMLDFKLDGSSNFQQFEGVDYSMNALAQAKAEAEMFGILDMGKRERKTVANYNENKLYQQQMAAGQVPSKPKKKKKNFKLPKELRLPRMEEWQMFNRERLLQIQEEEEKKFRDLPEEVQKRATAKKSDVVEVKEEEKKSESNEGESAGDVKMEDAAAVKSEPSADEKATSGGPSEVKAEVKEEGGDNDSPNSDEPFELPKLLDEETQAEKQELLAEGFSDWKRADYTAFVKASARYGRSNHEKIATEVGKSIPDVKAFAEAFWGHLGQQRIAEHEYDRVVKQIERGEKKIEEIKSLQRGARILISLFENPWDELEFNHINTNANTKDKLFSPENDRHLLCWAHKVSALNIASLISFTRVCSNGSFVVVQFGYGQWGAVKMAIRRSPRFRFDYFFRSCPLDMIGRRCELLMRCAGKEVEALERKAREDAGLPTEVEEGKELPPIELPPYKELQRRQRLASRKKFEEEKQDLESKVDNLETQIKAIQQQLKDLTNQANLPPPPPPPPPAQKENKVTNGDAKPAKKRTRSMDESPASENVAPTPASAPESSSKKESSPSDFDPSKGDLVDGEFVEFPEYDGSEEPKEPKKPFTQFCIRTRKEVKQSLDESERKNKSLVNEKLKDMWLKLEDQQKAVFRSWAAWDKKRYARDEEIYSKAKKQAKKKKKKSKSANESSIDSLHVPKKRQAGDSLSIPKKKRKS
jgi:SWI/SNF-related matrix-associated actin-dependent regulator of chromatin subfamily A member 5